MKLVLKSVDFRRERETTWHELDMLCTTIEKSGLGALSAAQLARLPVLYRSTLSSLSVARAISLDRNVLEFLESLTGRAYFCVYAAKRPLRESIADFFARRFPQAVRRFRWHLAMSALFLCAGVLAGYTITLGDPDRFYAFVSVDYAQGRGPASTTAELRKILYDDGGGGADKLTAFASFLFTHNAKIGILSFALGFAAGFPVFLLMLTNGLILGAFGALYQSRGLGLDFWAWVLPHGVTEIGALLLCGAGGLVLAESLVFPGRQTRLRNLAMRGREAGTIALGAVCMFFVAGLIEGLFRQSVQSVPIRISVVVVTAALWGWYFLGCGRGDAKVEEGTR
jgi:uncharacterized membrane protein SpoIIM required for sporulation